MTENHKALKRWKYRHFPNLGQLAVFCPYCDVNVNVMLDQDLEFQYCPYCGEEVDISKVEREWRIL